MMSLHNNTTVSKSGYVSNLSVTMTKYLSNTMHPEERLILHQSFGGFSLGIGALQRQHIPMGEHTGGVGNSHLVAGSDSDRGGDLPPTVLQEHTPSDLQPYSTPVRLSL